MKRIFIFHENPSLQEALKQTQPEILAALHHRHPQADSLTQDRELAQLHRLFALLRLGHLKLTTIRNLRNPLWHLQVRTEELD